MNKTMKAWRVYDFNDMRLDEIPIPDIKPGWALVKIKVAQPSITEVIGLQGGETMGKEKDTSPLQLSSKVNRRIKEDAPVQLFGHEFCAQVVEIGEGVREVKVGDRVSSPGGAMPCGQCELCLSGKREECRSGPILSIDFPGCFAEYALFPDELLFKLPDNIDDNEAPLIQPLIVCVRAAANVSLGDTVVILGQGSIGMFCMQAARVSGASLLVAIDIKDDILELAKKVGADITINATKDDPVQKVMEITKGVGADVVYEAAGGSPRQGLSGTKTMRQALDIVRGGGKIVPMAIITEPCPLDLGELRQKGINLALGGRLIPTSKVLNHAVRLVSSGRIKVKPMISHILHGLENIPEAFEITGNKKKYQATGPAQVIVSK